MAHQILVVISSDSSEYAKEEDVGSPVHSDAGNSPSVSSVSWNSSISGPPVSTDSESVAYCQCEEGTLAECRTCGSFFDIDTICPRC
jgi:RNA polymerase subunit RPABC4/transcription elongation factor Spt4